MYGENLLDTAQIVVSGSQPTLYHGVSPISTTKPQAAKQGLRALIWDEDEGSIGCLGKSSRNSYPPWHTGSPFYYGRSSCMSSSEGDAVDVIVSSRWQSLRSETRRFHGYTPWQKAQ